MEQKMILNKCTLQEKYEKMQITDEFIDFFVWIFVQNNFT